MIKEIITMLFLLVCWTSAIPTWKSEVAGAGHPVLKIQPQLSDDQKLELIQPAALTWGSRRGGYGSVHYGGGLGGGGGWKHPPGGYGGGYGGANGAGHHGAGLGWKRGHYG